jgi:hypothetical protein
MQRFTIRPTIWVLGALLAVLSISPSSMSAQTLVQQTPTVLTACTPINATAAVNNQVTLTLTPPSGQYVYLCGWDVVSSQNATATANTNVSYTSTNLGGWAWKYSMAATANLAISQPFYFNFPVKSAAPGTAVTLISPSALAQTSFSINAYYYFAP